MIIGGLDRKEKQESFTGFSVWGCGFTECRVSKVVSSGLRVLVVLERSGI